MFNRLINTKYSHLIKTLGIDDYIATLVEEIKWRTWKSPMGAMTGLDRAKSKNNAYLDGLGRVSSDKRRYRTLYL
jgi:hypothetical protein